MPHAALWVVQPEALYAAAEYSDVSMPHAALWVVQPAETPEHSAGHDCFNAARGFVGGAASSLAALVPLGGKSPFGKSPKI